MTIERSWGWRGHPLHFTVEKTEAKERRKSYLLKFIMSPNGILKFPLNPTLTSVSRIIITAVCSSQKSRVALGASHSPSTVNPPADHFQSTFQMLVRADSPTPPKLPAPWSQSILLSFLNSAGVSDLPLISAHTPPIPPESPPHKSPE